MNMDFKSAKELLDLCEENQLPISEVMRQRECILGEVPRHGRSCALLPPSR